MTGKHDKKADDEQSANLLLTGPIAIRGLGRGVKDALLPGRPSRHRASADDGSGADPVPIPLMLENGPTLAESGPSSDLDDRDAMRAALLALVFPPDAAVAQTEDFDGSQEDRVDDRREDDQRSADADVEQPWGQDPESVAPDTDSAPMAEDGAGQEEDPDAADVNEPVVDFGGAEDVAQADVPDEPPVSEDDAAQPVEDAVATDDLESAVDPEPSEGPDEQTDAAADVSMSVADDASVDDPAVAAASPAVEDHRDEDESFSAPDAVSASDAAEPVEESGPAAEDGAVVESDADGPEWIEPEPVPEGQESGDALAIEEAPVELPSIEPGPGPGPEPEPEPDAAPASVAEDAAVDESTPGAPVDEPPAVEAEDPRADGEQVDDVVPFGDEPVSVESGGDAPPVAVDHVDEVASVADDAAITEAASEDESADEPLQAEAGVMGSDGGEAVPDVESAVLVEPEPEPEPAADPDPFDAAPEPRDADDDAPDDSTEHPVDDRTLLEEPSDSEQEDARGDASTPATGVADEPSGEDATDQDPVDGIASDVPPPAAAEEPESEPERTAAEELIDGPSPIEPPTDEGPTTAPEATVDVVAVPAEDTGEAAPTAVPGSADDEDVAVPAAAEPVAAEEGAAVIAPNAAALVATPSAAPRASGSGGGRPPRRPRPARVRFGSEAIGIAVLVVLALVCGGLITAVVLKTQRDSAIAAAEAANYTPPPLATPEPTATGPVVAIIGDGTTSAAASGVTSAQRWSAVLGASLGGTVEADASSGMGYAAKGDSDETFVTAAAKIPSNAQVVVFFGGAADANVSNLSVAKAAVDAIAAAKAQAPDATILVIGPAVSDGVSSGDLTAIRNALRSASGISKATWIDPIGDKWLSSDRLSGKPTDLTAEDEKTLATKIESAVKDALP